MQSRSIDFANQRKILLTDLLVTGTGYYKTYCTPEKTNVTLEVLNPINTFIDRNPDSPYLKDSARAVVRKYMTKDQILAKYGDVLTSASAPLSSNSIIPEASYLFKLNIKTEEELMPGDYLINATVALEDESVLASKEVKFRI